MEMGFIIHVSVEWGQYINAYAVKIKIEICIIYQFT